MLYALGALISVLIAAYFFYSIRGSEDVGIMPIILGIVFLVLTIIFGALFLSSRVNKSEDIHITE